MEVSFLDLREKEIINVYSGRRLGKILDVVFNVASGEVLGVVVPGDRKLFKKSDDIFVPLQKIKRIGEDVILVGIQQDQNVFTQKQKSDKRKGNIDSYYENGYIPQYVGARGGENGYASQYTGARGGAGAGSVQNSVQVQNSSFQNSYGQARAVNAVASNSGASAGGNFFAENQNSEFQNQYANFRPAAATYMQNKQTKGQSRTNSSYVRLRPLESKKYK